MNRGGKIMLLNDTQKMHIDWRTGELIKAIEKAGKNTESKRKERTLFKCRICGCTEYEGVFGDSSFVPMGGRMYPSAYQCSGCSVVFKDIEKFTVEKESKKDVIDEIWGKEDDQI